VLSKYIVFPTFNVDISAAVHFIFFPSAVLDAKNLEICCETNCGVGVCEISGNIGSPKVLSSYI
jgi:hypothetical protein